MKVSLAFFIDDENGEYGLAHLNAIDRGFNAFWSGIGVFHDVFEHWFEDTHKYFQGEYAFNVGGEMAAMGACWYYYHELGVMNRELTSYRPFGDSIIGQTLHDVEEAIKYGYCSFGSDLMSAVPRQRNYNSCLTDGLKRRWKDLPEWEPQREDPDEMEAGIAYKQSVTIDKIINLHQYGHRMAERLVPDNIHNQTTLIRFIKYWDNFCNVNPANEMWLLFTGIDFFISKVNDNVVWNARLYKKGGGYIKLNENIEFDLETVPHFPKQ